MLQVAILRGHSSLVTLLLKRGANVSHRDQQGRGMVSACVFSCAPNPSVKTKMVKALVSCGATLNEADANGRTPMILATLEKQPQMVAAFIELGADMDVIDSECYTAVAYAVKNDWHELVELFLRRNAATHILEANGRSVFSVACLFGARRALAALMERGLDEMHRDNSGWTPLHEAACAPHLEIAQMLLDYGSEVCRV